LKTISPALKAGKNVYVEWPLGKSLAEAKELLRLKNEGGVRRLLWDCTHDKHRSSRKFKEIIESGRIGEVFGSTWVGQGSVGGEVTTEGYEYLTRREVGGNLVTIHFGHAIDFVQSGNSPLLPNQKSKLTIK
jgi:predicted dehydrogenase